MIVTTRLRGTLRWFNEEKDRGVLESDGGERLEVPGEAFAEGERPVGRCAGTLVEFRLDAFGRPSDVSAVELLPAKRARRRH